MTPLLPVAAAALLAAAPFAVAADEPRARPNIVVILADDMGYGDVSCLNKNSKIVTPAVDRLAREGMLFTDAHSGSSVCTPTRYGLLTGRYAWRTRLQRGVLAPWAKPLIEPARLTVAALLKKHGYHTACVGKWHLGWDWPTAADDRKRDFTQPIPGGPTACGFEYYFGTDVPNYPPYCFIENDRTVGIPSGWKEMQNLDGRPGPMLPGWKFDAILPTLTEKAVEYVAARAADGKPFFLYFPLTSPHEPIAPSERFRGKSGINAQADFMLETDWAVGAVLAALDRHKLAENTLVIFTTDNGHSTYTGLAELRKAGHEPGGPLRGYKTDIYEGGHRVPFTARWPGRIAAGARSDETICHNDLIATVAAVLGAKLPDDAGEDSFNILPALLGEKRSAPIRESTVHHSAAGQFAIRKGPWKLIAGMDPKAAAKTKGKAPTEDELYNLVEDLGETRNLAAAQPETVARLKELLEKRRREGRSR